MGAKYPKENINKETVLELAQDDGFRGVYIPWGGMHNMSFCLGGLAGILFMYGIYLIGHAS